MHATAPSLLDARASTNLTSIIRTLERFGEPALRFAAKRGIKILPLAHGARYDEMSPALRRLNAGVDDWPAPPAGLFVVEERTVYLKSCSPMTVAHEFGHGLDCALGDGIYRSSFDPEPRELFKNARSFITPYAATSVDEYFAEGLRAFVECNDASSFWPRATKLRLRRVDPHLFAYVERLFCCEFRTAA